jgi:hypothetical protein
VKRMRLLVISPHYTTFVKGHVEAQSKYVDEITVLVRHSRLVELSNYSLFGRYLNHIKRYSKNMIEMRNKLRNIRIHLIPSIYFVSDGNNKRLGYKFPNKFKRCIDKIDGM